MKTPKKYCFIIAFGVFVISTRTSAQGIDVRILAAINLRHPTSQFWKLTSTSAYIFSGVAAARPFVYGIAADNAEARYNSYQELIGTGINIILMEGLKKSINRERPGDKYPGLIFPSSTVHGKSFSSGHTSLAFNTAAELTIEYKKWFIAVPAYLWAGS